jgi:hypothetical protein
MTTKLHFHAAELFPDQLKPAATAWLQTGMVEL